MSVPFAFHGPAAPGVQHHLKRSALLQTLLLDSIPDNSGSYTVMTCPNLTPGSCGPPSGASATRKFDTVEIEKP